MKMKMKEIEKWVRFWILLIKISLFKIFHENLRKIFLTHFQAISNQSRQKWRWKKFEKMSSIFEFSISKFSRKSVEKNFHLFFRTFLTNRSKMKMNMKKFGKMSSIFECSISKSSCTGLFIKILEKTVFFEIFTWKGHI